MLSFFALACGTAPAADSGVSPPQHLLLVSIDTLRVDHLEHAPTLQRLADEGLVLRAHRSCANWTAPAMICALTGQSGIDLGVDPRNAGALRTTWSLPEHAELLAEVLQAEGFATGLVTTNSLLARGNGLARGYDTLESRPAAVAEDALDATDALFVDAERRFVHVHLFDPHCPYAPPGSDDTLGSPYCMGEPSATSPSAETVAELAADYVTEVAYLDLQLGRALERWGAAGWLDDTLTVVMSDHGEQLGERAEIGHGLDVFAEETDALAIFAGVGGPDIEVPTQHQDLKPLILQHLGLLEGFEVRERPLLVASIDAESTVLALERESWLYRRGWDGSRALYDRATDPEQLVDRRDDEPELAAELEVAMEDEVARLLAIYPEWEPE